MYEQQFEEEILENRGKNEGSSIITKQENFLLSSRSKPLEKTNLLGSFISESAQRYENSSTRGIPIAEKDVPLTRDGVHEAYMKRTLEIISPILRTLHVFREMGELSELATYYNANRLVGFVFQCDSFQLSVKMYFCCHVASAPAPGISDRRCCNDNTGKVYGSASDTS